MIIKRLAEERASIPIAPADQEAAASLISTASWYFLSASDHYYQRSPAVPIALVLRHGPARLKARQLAGREWVRTVRLGPLAIGEAIIIGNEQRRSGGNLRRGTNCD
jgi:hypothetical protein